jgi:hypothetical protein
MPVQTDARDFRCEFRSRESPTWPCDGSFLEEVLLTSAWTRFLRSIAGCSPTLSGSAWTGVSRAGGLPGLRARHRAAQAGRAGSVSESFLPGGGRGRLRAKSGGPPSSVGTAVGEHCLEPASAAYGRTYYNDDGPLFFDNQYDVTWVVVSDHPNICKCSPYPEVSPHMRPKTPQNTG